MDDEYIPESTPASQEMYSEDDFSDEEYPGAGDISLILNYQFTPEQEAIEFFDNSQPSLTTAPTSELVLRNSEECAASPALSDSVHDLDDLSTQSEMPGDLSVDDDPPLIIAYDRDVWQRMKESQLSWGVCFEVARLVSKGSLFRPEEITLEKLRGSNKDAAPNVSHVFANAKTESGGFDHALAQEMMATSPWEELDREEEALALGPYEGIGNNPRFPGWYGGKVVFQGQLVDQNGEYKVILDSCTLGGSSRLARRFGSWSILRIKVPQSIFYRDDWDSVSFFRRPFIIWDRVFRVFDAKECKIFLYCTNEVYPSGPASVGRLSFEEFIEWHNPMSENKNQLMTKWSARMGLGLSTSIPGPRLLQQNIQNENDIVSFEGSDMTDGCGLSSKNIHIYLSHNLELQFPPAAFQFRLGGYKGMSLLQDIGPISEDMQIWCRPSQRKICYGEDTGLELDPTKLTIDVLRISLMRTPAQFSRDVIVNLAENDVPISIFTRLLSTSIRAIVEGLTTWDGPEAMFKLWINVERAGCVLTARRARESVGEARLRGYVHKSQDEMAGEDEDEDEEDDQNLEEGITGRSTPWWQDYISGCPSGLEETVMMMLDAGFTPQENPFLREKLHKIVRSRIENRLQKLKFDVDQACVAFAVPDPFGVLGPDEIQVKSSNRNLRANDGLLTDTVLGDVLVTRNPCKISTDVRKVKAVEHPSLRNFVDVVVFSIQGKRRLIDFLSGGDYDGDKVLVIWMDEIVLPFQNADERHAIEPPSLDMAFDRDQETVADFMIKIAPSTEHDRRRALQEYLLGPLKDPTLRGSYSNMHDFATYRNGYNNPTTVRLAFKFCRVMDGAKTGWRIKQERFRADQLSNVGRLRWKEFVGKKKKTKTPMSSNTSNLGYLQRDPESVFVNGIFVMDALVDVADEEMNVLLAEMDNNVFAPLTIGHDPDLTAPWEDLEQWAERGAPEMVKMKRKDLSKIAIHVQAQYRSHASMMRQPTKQIHQTFSSLPIHHRQDLLRKASKDFASGPPLEQLTTIADPVQLARVRASYAYKYDAENKRGWSQFPFAVAMRDLCEIKARKSGVGIHKVVQNSFYERFKLVHGT